MKKYKNKIQDYFGLSYAEYPTIPRSVLQSMPDEWQEKIVSLLEELDETIDWMPSDGTYKVSLRKIIEMYDEEEKSFIQKWGDELEDPLRNYERGRRKLPHKDIDKQHLL